MSTPCFHVDAFTDRPFAGNPAAVCLLDAARPAKWMQVFAAEMNLSETAFVAPGKTHLQLRWFTPVAEVALCGHATLATAHVLWSEGIAPKGIDLRFTTKSGVLTARQLSKGRVELDFPARPALKGKVAGAALAKALGAKPKAIVKVADDVLVELASEAAVRGLTPDLAKLAKVDARGVIVTARSKKHDFVSRFFGPRVGVPEDPVTGSAHCALAPYWAGKLGKTDLKGYQASARGGEVECQLAGDRVLLRGSAVTVMRATILA
ncbi:MAG: PhzF family phenazine biosynthesis isomerase [Planctomycetes bacterium]|nr:PhzF family phenazine biosynthesis isomerase [Planctomycetota bacterium]